MIKIKVLIIVIIFKMITTTSIIIIIIIIIKLIVWVGTICFWKSERIATRRNDLLPIGMICYQ